MWNEIAVIVSALLIILLITVLMSNTPKPPTPHLPHHCKCEGHTETQRKIFEDMNATAAHPKYQPVYTLYRSTPKDTVTNAERKYCEKAVEWFSKNKLSLLDIDNVAWMAETEGSPIIAQLDARVKVTGTHEVVRVIMMWQERQLWVIHLANAKGCNASIKCAKNCEVEYGVVSNKPIQMDQYKVMKSIMGRE